MNVSQQPEESPRPCPDCGLVYQCICQAIPRCTSGIKLSLLIHEREINRATNTGRWLVHALPQCQPYLWQRKQPDVQFQQQLDDPRFFPVLLFPAPHALTVDELCAQIHSEHKHQTQPHNHQTQQHQLVPHFILLDGTWQEARKMERKSAWLATLPRVQITPNAASSYRLRRNQQPDSLCTLEVVATLLEQRGETKDAQALKDFLHLFMDALQADKNRTPGRWDSNR
ncbi:tRNA-uridine aminocarboxypropyltransferase [Vibrio gazogenes]|uniref:tRNA-uridine aminocarboxypropyltransferase n=1 Tax=Vibrio gazogenes DSM 21264 = NBRC 103151 TaxID=1123492 RepID=A0A1M5BT83_VIBGA|nr:DTW domain-containing protein [Vibrio gazogenes]USP13663.1 DTW domain-containing protein [Vibrio gazogenes]SHF45749.1 DTW domain-containing protein YfiP [Vibrio gazogenes DSM 21264] [Vibrio gazogenes DSM 21264 = NBRC 103151]SJN55746.1 DTW domain protein [Vibrio gazogenes]